MKRNRWLRLIGHFVVRLCGLLALSAFLYALPDPDVGEFVRLKNALISFFTVIGIGTLIYNTFFYERYRM